MGLGVENSSGWAGRRVFSEARAWRQLQDTASHPKPTKASGDQERPSTRSPESCYGADSPSLIQFHAIYGPDSYCSKPVHKGCGTAHCVECLPSLNGRLLPSPMGREVQNVQLARVRKCSEAPSLPRQQSKATALTCVVGRGIKCFFHFQCDFQALPWL